PIAGEWPPSLVPIRAGEPLALAVREVYETLHERARRVKRTSTASETAGAREEESVARVKVVTPAGGGVGLSDVGYDSEMEALAPLGVEIVEIPAGSEEDFIRAAHDADALYAKARGITARMIDGLERCRVIALGTVGVDSVDVAAATARG